MISTAPIPDTFNALLLDIRNYIEQRLKINECGSIQSGPSRSTPTDKENPLEKIYIIVHKD